MKRHRLLGAAMLGGVIVAGIVACHGGASPAAQSRAAVQAKHAITDTTWSATARAVRLAPVIITAPAE